MLDTVVLTLDHELFKYDQTRLEKQFNKSGIWWSYEIRPFNHQEQMKKKGIYAPHFELVSSQKTYQKLRITFSIPKLFFQTNLYEIKPEELELIYSALSEQARFAGITLLNDNALKNCELIGVHFSKNIELPAWIGNAGQVINLFEKLNYRPRSTFNLNKAESGKDGDYIKYTSSSSGFIVYDKISEIIEKQITSTEKNIVEKTKNGLQKNNILRFELQLYKDQTMDSFLYKFTGKLQHRLDDVMDIKISRESILKQFDEIFSPEIIRLISISEQRFNIFENLMDIARLKIEKRALLHYLGNKLDKIGEKQLWNEIKFKFGDNKYYRLRKELKILINQLKKHQVDQSNIIDFIREELKKFILIRPPG